MKTLIVYESMHGCAEKCAGSLKKLLEKETDVVNLKSLILPSVSAYDIVIIGGSVHFAKPGNKMLKFLNKNHKELINKHFGIYVCHMEDEYTTFQALEKKMPLELLNHSQAIGFFGGEFDYEKMNIFQKSLVKKNSGLTNSTSAVKEDNIRNFANYFNNIE